MVWLKSSTFPFVSPKLGFVTSVGLVLFFFPGTYNETFIFLTPVGYGYLTLFLFLIPCGSIHIHHISIIDWKYIFDPHGYVTGVFFDALIDVDY